MTVSKLCFLLAVLSSFSSHDSSFSTITVMALSRIQDVAKRHRRRDEERGGGGGTIMRVLPATGQHHNPPGGAAGSINPRGGRQHQHHVPAAGGKNHGMHHQSIMSKKRVFKTWKVKRSTKGKGILVAKGKGRHKKPSPASTLAPTMASVIIVPDCFSNTTKLFHFMLEQEATNPVASASYIYTLCPNTVFNIGIVNERGQCCVDDGMNALVAKSQSHVRCGDSGSSDNNCTLVGGQVQLVSGPSFFQQDAATDVAFQGITFEAAIDTGVLLAHRGDVTFIDCVFKVRE
jgi:hypothetical protein